MKPPLDDSESREPVSVRFSGPEKKKLATGAKAHGKALATWARETSLVGNEVIRLQERVEDYVRNTVPRKAK
tara:strand:- start:4982 stop:5197 length:216 start_codon:yes stop_codon:yes gene_type:complete